MRKRYSTLLIFLISFGACFSLFAAGFAEFNDNFVDNNFPAQKGKIAYLEVTAGAPKYDINGLSTVPINIKGIIGRAGTHLPEGFQFMLFAEVSPQLIVRDPAKPNKAFVAVQLGEPSMNYDKSDVNYELTIRTQNFKAFETAKISGGVILESFAGPLAKTLEVVSEIEANVKHDVPRSILITAKTLEERGLLSKAEKRAQVSLYKKPIVIRCINLF